MKNSKPRSYRNNHEPPSKEQNERRTVWRRITVRCILADVKHGKPVDPDLVEWAKAQKW